MFSSVFVFVLAFMLLETPLLVRAGLYVRLLPCMRVEINMNAFVRWYRPPRDPYAMEDNHARLNG